MIVATPSHQHREIVLALQAGKHVYCEAPLAASIEDARAIAKAAKAAAKTEFSVRPPDALGPATLSGP